MAEAEKQAKPTAPPPLTVPKPVTPANATPTAEPPGGNAVAAKKPTDEKEEASKVLPAPPSAPIELQGAGLFEPTPEVAQYIKQGRSKGVPIPVKFGNVSKAGGTIQVAGNGKNFHTVDNQAILIDHPFLGPLAQFEPMLRIRIGATSANAITGYAAPKEALHSIEKIDKLIREAGPALGLLGFDLSNLNFENKIEAGVFKLGTKKPVEVTVAGWVKLALDMGLENDALRFSATGNVKVRGLAEAQLSLSRDPKGNVTGQADLAVNIAKFSGKATATYNNGDISVTGTLSYSTEKLKGSVTVVAMEAAEAEKKAREQIDPQNLVTEETSDAEKKPEKFKKGERGIAGWGELDFAFTDWFTGKAKVIYGPAGYITIIGKIAPPKSIELMKERVWNTNLFSLDISARYGVPYVADIHVGIGVALGAVARIGPAILTDMSVEGVYSTDPAVLNSFAISGAFRISAYAGLNLRFEGKAGLTILKHDVDFGAALTGKAGIKGYAEARPTLGYREKADPVAGKKGEYYMKGHLEIAAQPFVGLDGELFVRLDSPWWSPAPDKTWTWPLFSLEYPLPGEFGIGADIDYVIGSDQWPEIKWGKADFDASKFSDSLLDDKIPPKKVGGDVPKAGSWKGEEPAPPTAPPGPASEGAKAPGGAEPKGGSPSPAGGKGGGQRPEEATAVPRTPDAARRFSDGMQALGDLHELAERDPETSEEIHAHLASIKKRFGFTKLDPHLEGDHWVIDAALNTTNKNAPKKTTVKADKAVDPAKKPANDEEARLHERKGWTYQYGEQKKVTGDGSVDRDHQPSKAAIKFAAIAMIDRLVKAGEITKPTTAQMKRIKDRIDKRALSVVVDKEVHKAGPTHGNKNDESRITSDARELGVAAARDADAMLVNAGRIDPDHIARYREAAATVKRQTHASILAWVEEIIIDVMEED